MVRIPGDPLGRDREGVGVAARVRRSRSESEGVGVAARVRGSGSESKGV
jgi:hypothetical protein